jgi:hypothetical protein
MTALREKLNVLHNSNHLMRTSKDLNPVMKQTMVIAMAMALVPVVVATLSKAVTINLISTSVTTTMMMAAMTVGMVAAVMVASAMVTVTLSKVVAISLTLNSGNSLTSKIKTNSFSTPEDWKEP